MKREIADAQNEIQFNGVLPRGTVVCVRTSCLPVLQRPLFERFEWDSVNGEQYVFGRLAESTDLSDSKSVQVLSKISFLFFSFYHFFW